MTNTLSSATENSIIARLQTLLILPLVTVLLFCTTDASLAAQENPFATAEANPFLGEGDNPFGGGATTELEPETADPQTDRKRVAVPDEPVVSPNAPEATRLLIRAVKQQQPATPAALAKAVSVMLNLKQYDFAKFYFAKLDAAVTTDEERSQLVQTMGGDFFLSLHATPELAPAGRAFAKELLSVGKRMEQSPESIAKQIRLLNHSDIAIRSRAFRRLRRIGPTAIAAMIEVFADADREKEFPGLRGAMQNLEDQAIPLLRGAARASNASVQLEAIRALSHYRGQAVLTTLRTIALNPAVAPSARRAAINGLSRMGARVPDQHEITKPLRQQANELLSGKQRVPGNLVGTTVTWSWDDAAKKLQPNNGTIATASRFEAARLATDLFQIAPQPIHRDLYLLTQLEVAKRLAGSARAVDIRTFANRLLPQAGTLTAHELNRLLEQAVERKTIPAAIACCEMLAKSASPAVFRTENNRVCAVVEAIMLGDRHLQHAALGVIDAVNPTFAYPGSSHAVTLAVFLANTQQTATGLVGHHRIEAAQLVAGSLAAAGLAGKATGSSSDFFAAATHNPDISLLLVSDSLVRPRFDQLIRQLRSDFRTARTPIGLMVRDEASRRRVSYLIADDRLTLAFPAAVDGELLANYLRQTADVEDAELTSVSDGQRYEHARQAIDWLVKVSSEREQYCFYELGRHQQQLAALLYSPGLADAATKVLANVGTPLAQRELANFASQKTLPAEDRQLAADALGRSIKNGSTLLTKDQIRQQYDRYNASETDSVDSQRILGSILDAIETRAAPGLPRGQ